MEWFATGEWKKIANGEYPDDGQWVHVTIGRGGKRDTKYRYVEECVYFSPDSVSRLENEFSKDWLERKFKESPDGIFLEWHTDGFYDFLMNASEAIAWMPFPEPYSG